MDSGNIIRSTFLFFGLLLAATNQLNGQAKRNGPTQDLYSNLANKDSLLFNAVFKTCNIKELENILDVSFVFYQDKGYAAHTTVQPRKEFLEKIRESCSKKNSGEGMSMRREVVKASLQVERINQHEAIQTGVQHFYLMQEDGKEQLVEESKFSRDWQNKNGEWKLARELDFMINVQAQDHNPPVQTGQRFQPGPYVPASEKLYNTIVTLDSLYFDTYNTCNLQNMRSMMSDSLEFYHDRGGLTTSIEDFMLSIKNNICGKVTRRAVPGSIEVYPIHNYGAVEIGYHRFFNNQEPENGYSKPDKYIVIWQEKAGDWKITRVVSLH